MFDMFLYNTRRGLITSPCSMPYSSPAALPVLQVIS